MKLKMRQKKTFISKIFREQFFCEQIKIGEKKNRNENKTIK